MKDKVEEVAEVVRRIPAGNVSTYGEVAKVAGCHARYVGWVMRKVPGLPWWRVVRADGTSHAPKRSIPRWEEEEIAHTGARVDMRQHGLDATDLKQLA
ncbi:cysteine methyltransferase [Corynebacterium striatum]|uniref:Cysteine methyltransferase n=1 Tax=Corynebacterium striatum TaxID=43770 RepID=A0A2Z2IVU0_CORST|nr:MGMT family protein [Corynebacterium striatum]ART20136.1 cysteine methyltransferase [Corynebacterium striatum]HCG2962525.1 MGMT family protein [Corynebacterium striatum]